MVDAILAPVYAWIRTTGNYHYYIKLGLDKAIVRPRLESFILYRDGDTRYRCIIKKSTI